MGAKISSKQDKKPEEEAQGKPTSKRVPSTDEGLRSPVGLRREPPIPSKMPAVEDARKTVYSAEPTNSISEAYRKKGNKCYENFIASTNLQDKKKYIQNAIGFYRQAFDVASDSAQDAASSAKNLGTATLKLIDILMEINSNPGLVGPQYLEATTFISRALSVGKKFMPAKWTRDLELIYAKCVESSMQHIQRNVAYERQMGSIETFIQAMTENSQKATCYLEVANFTFRKGVVALSEKDFKTALHEFRDCHRPTQEAERFAREIGGNAGKILKEAKIIEADLVFHLASAESLQAIDTGDKLLKIAMENHEALSTDLVYDVIDWFKKGVVGAREIDMEVEAIALSRLGCLYDKVLKIKFKAKEYFLRSMQLGVSLFPKSVNNDDWFLRCMEAMKRYQQEAAKIDDSAQYEERKKYLDELTVELGKLNVAARRGAVELIKFVYKTFPPKDPKHCIPEDELNDSKCTKKVLLKAILHYHPDKQNAEVHSKKWQVLCGEITKEFTSKYECYKLG